MRPLEEIKFIKIYLYLPALDCAKDFCEACITDAFAL